MRDIETLIANIGGAQNCADLFIEAEYQHPQNKQFYKEYLLTRDGFSLLVMGFTGSKALEWKLKYIEAFNKMEQALKNQTKPTCIEDVLIQSLQEMKAVKQTALEAKEEAAKSREERQARLEAEKLRDKLIHQNKLYTTSEIAKELGLKSATKLNSLLAEKKIQYKQNKTWLLYSKYADCGYVSIKQDILDSGHIIYDRKWSGKGRDFILNLFKEEM